MTLQALPYAFTVCKVPSPAHIDLTAPFTFAGVTDGECSLVCQTAFAPVETAAREDGWRAFRVKGSMAFGLVGVLSRITGTLAAAGIAVFAVSTFDTDYVLVKAERFEAALCALGAEGFAVERMAEA
jgi:hypothetical protein